MRVDSVHTTYKIWRYILVMRYAVFDMWGVGLMHGGQALGSHGMGFFFLANSESGDAFVLTSVEIIEHN